MDAAKFALLFTTITGALLAIATLLVNRKTSNVTTKVEDTKVAFDAMKITVDTLSSENTRIQAHLKVLEEENSKCEEKRKKLVKVIEAQAVEISQLTTSVERLKGREPSSPSS